MKKTLCLTTGQMMRLMKRKLTSCLLLCDFKYIIRNSGTSQAVSQFEYLHILTELC